MFLFCIHCSPLGSPDSAGIMRRSADGRKLIEDPTVLQLAAKLNKSPAQVWVAGLPQTGWLWRSHSVLCACSMQLVGDCSAVLSNPSCCRDVSQSPGCRPVHACIHW